jgi:hypothetical protein
VSFCSRASIGSHEVLAGTGVRAEAYVFLPVPKRLWHGSELNESWAAPAELAAIRAARPEGVVVRLYNPRTPDPPVLVHAAPQRPPPTGLAPLLATFGGRWPAEPGPPPPRLAVCTHGTRDRCCAKWGFAVFRRAQALFDAGASPFEPIESSHLGGDRFAATGVVFPSGSMYGHLDEADLADLLAREAAGEMSPASYRGRVFEPALTQVVRAGLARDGFAVDATAPLEIERDADGRLRVDCAAGRFLATVETAEVAFYPSCRRMAAGGLTRGRRPVYAGASRLDGPDQAAAGRSGA